MSVNSGHDTLSYTGIMTPGQSFGCHKFNLFHQLAHTFGVLRQDGQNQSEASFRPSSQTLIVYTSKLDLIKETAETIAMDVVLNFNSAHQKKPRNVYSKTMRRVVKEISDRHDMVFKGMVKKLKPDEDNFYSTFVTVADEIFHDGHVNWGRIAALYSFATRIAKYHMDKNFSSPTSKSNGSVTSAEEVLHVENIARFLGKYVGNKLGKWILEHGGWDAFVEFFPDHREFEENMWKGLLFTAIGLTALATVVASR